MGGYVPRVREELRSFWTWWSDLKGFRLNRLEDLVPDLEGISWLEDVDAA